MTRYTFVCLKNTEVRPEYTDSLSSRLLISTEIGPTWRQAIENRDGSSARPSPPLIPPVRAWLMWQATPGTFGSSNALSSEFCGPIAVTLKGGDMSVPFTMIVEPTQ